MLSKIKRLFSRDKQKAQPSGKSDDSRDTKKVVPTTIEEVQAATTFDFIRKLEAAHKVRYAKEKGPSSANRKEQTDIYNCDICYAGIESQKAGTHFTDYYVLTSPTWWRRMIDDFRQRQ